jgi:hypothetical protein
MLSGILAVPKPTSEAAAKTTSASGWSDFSGSEELEQPSADKTSKNSEPTSPNDDLLNVNDFLSAT